jgi:Na+/phosphate symporter
VNTTISRLDDDSEDVGINYIKSMYFLHEIGLSNDRIVKPLYDYVANSHKQILDEQQNDLYSAVGMVENSYKKALEIVNTNDYAKLDEFLVDRDEMVAELDLLRKVQVKRIKNKTVGTRNSVLFFDTVSEIRHLLIYVGNFLVSYKDFDARVKNGPSETEE